MITTNDFYCPDCHVVHLFPKRTMQISTRVSSIFKNKEETCIMISGVDLHACDSCESRVKNTVKGGDDNK